MLPRLKISKDYQDLWRVHMLVWCDRGAPLHFTLARFEYHGLARAFAFSLINGAHTAYKIRAWAHIPTIIEQHEAAIRERGGVTCQV